ncbi:hypothetical protein P879_11257 [Paragonimus westermani]|uniref:Uncharacterized protein n=1 Tax=Paragonimus westermani TaxID=34504 RepID=A0A8T0DFQ8_9TREM|nr:hypothetical protein P879_11257 [Paragonimus westermani]
MIETPPSTRQQCMTHLDAVVPSAHDNSHRIGLSLSQHRRKAHPTEYNADCLARLTTTRYNWSRLEDALLTKYANQLSNHSPMLKDLCVAIAIKMENRSNESIKKPPQLLR